MKSGGNLALVDLASLLPVKACPSVGLSFSHANWCSALCYSCKLLLRVLCTSCGLHKKLRFKLIYGCLWSDSHNLSHTIRPQSICQQNYVNLTQTRFRASRAIQLHSQSVTNIHMSGASGLRQRNPSKNLKVFSWDHIAPHNGWACKRMTWGVLRF